MKRRTRPNNAFNSGACPAAPCGHSGTRHFNLVSLENGHDRSVPEVLEVCRNTEIATAHELNYGLQVVFLFSGDTNLQVL